MSKQEFRPWNCNCFVCSIYNKRKQGKFMSNFFKWWTLEVRWPWPWHPPQRPDATQLHQSFSDAKSGGRGSRGLGCILTDRWAERKSGNVVSNLEYRSIISLSLTLSFFLFKNFKFCNFSGNSEINLKKQFSIVFNIRQLLFSQYFFYSPIFTRVIFTIAKNSRKTFELFLFTKKSLSNLIDFKLIKNRRKN